MTILRMGFLVLASSFWISSPLGCRWLDTNEPTEFECPDQFFIRISGNKFLEVYCQWESDEFLDLVPDLTIPNLQSLRMEGCSVDMFVQVFKRAQMPNLILLDLRLVPSRNGSKITRETFSQLQSLEALKIQENSTSLSRNFLINLKQLKNLSLNSNGLLYIDFNLESATSLLHLDLSFNRIETLENRSFKGLHQLRYLSLEDNSLLHFSKQAFEGLCNLMELDMSGNKISLISQDSFSLLPNLTKISVARNRIVQIHSRLFAHNVFLEEIWLSSNQISNLPGSLFRPCSRLQTLQLQGNRLRQLPVDLFQGLQTLTNLDLSGNNFTTLSLPGEVFFALTKLRRLNLSYNNLSNISMTLFVGLHSLKRLLLHNAAISQLPQPLSGLDLDLLDLSSNNISHLQILDILNSKIFHVDLANNRIEQLVFNVSERLTGRRQEIDLESNPINCDCSNYELISFNHGAYPQLERQLKIMQPKLECANLRGTLVRQFRPRDIHCNVVANCPKECECISTPALNRLVLNCSEKQLERLPSRLEFGSMKVKLDLSGKRLESIAWVPTAVQELSLENNRLKNLEPQFLASLDNSPTLKWLHLKGNPWECNCQSLELQKFIQNNFHKMNSSEVYCQNTQTLLVNMRLYCPSMMMASLPICLFLLVCLATILALYFRFQLDIKVFLHANNLCLSFLENDLDGDKTYDVFISYSNKDEAFVLEHLVAELEKGAQPYRVCIHSRDWVPGRLIMDQISYSVQESNRTLVVLSNNYLDSVWGKMEFRVAHTQMHGGSKVVVVIYPGLDMERLDDELKNYLKTNTYVKWGERFFWSKLKYALRQSRNQKQMQWGTDGT
ncbi:protein toll [Dendroctonus ponderosae]|uniref:TIR domain-containing protein n=1 Tax=Dendroctonus ponderosae TaxID=77166 RepID=A0AAR5Q5X9_DENPD|nr:protein toll [Dendroctonus ponderosae]XP_019768654.1 protein toll [Dendroctonus ponderosae]KAH1022737.1 hypothetical protein HUJ04_012086 [Dendroctonus ponderosae]KAH1029200.1 hypothetical protein HUJ05_002479 [Dendroctonus ponderosae]